MASEDATALPDLGAVAAEPEHAGNGGAPPAPAVEESLETTPEVRGDAALKEDEPKTVTFRVRDVELELTLKPKLAASVMYRAGIMRDDDGQAVARLIQSVVGDAQFDAVMDKMDDVGLDIESEEHLTAMGNLLRDALTEYGVTQGES